MHVCCAKSTSGERVGLNQIVCVHKAEGIVYKLGVVTMTSVTRTGQLYIGVRYLPGQPRTAIVRGNSSNNLLSGAASCAHPSRDDLPCVFRPALSFRANGLA